MLGSKAVLVIKSVYYIVMFVLSIKVVIGIFILHGYLSEKVLIMTKCEKLNGLYVNGKCIEYKEVSND